MAASAWAVHDKAKEYLGLKVINLDIDVFYMILCTSTSNVHTLATDAYSTVTNEVVQNFGYLTGGADCGATTWTNNSGTITFRCNDVIWNVVGGSLVARYAGIRDTSVGSPVSNPILCSCSLDTIDVTVPTGNSFTVKIHASGVFTLA